MEIHEDGRYHLNHMLRMYTELLECMGCTDIKAWMGAEADEDGNVELHWTWTPPRAEYHDMSELGTVFEDRQTNG
jgi:hypothetical protein